MLGDRSDKFTDLKELLILLWSTVLRCMAARSGHIYIQRTCSLEMCGPAEYILREVSLYSLVLPPHVYATGLTCWVTGARSLQVRRSYLFSFGRLYLAAWQHDRGISIYNVLVVCKCVGQQNIFHVR